MARGESVRSLKDIGALRGACITDAKAEALLNFIEQFQRRNNGSTPTIRAMSNELGVPEEAVRILLTRMENKGRIHFISRIGPVIMVIRPDTKLPHDPGLSQTGVAPTPEVAAERYLSVEGQRMKLGRFIAENERAGCPTTLRAMMDHIGYDNAAYVSRMAEILSERGLIQYGNGIPTRLTEHGRNFFGVKQMMEETMGRTTTEDRTVVVVRTEGRRPTPRQRVNQLCRLVIEHGDDDGFCRLRQIDLAEKMGASNSAVVVWAAEARRLGYIADQKKRTHGLRITEKGLRMFGPQPELASDTQPDPEKIESADLPLLSEHILREDAEEKDFAEYRPPERLKRAIIETTEPVMSLDLVLRAVAVAPTEKLLMELIERGYVVTKGSRA